jgi:hypothetical protein
LIRQNSDTCGIEFTDKQLEDFVNQYKSSWDILNDAFIKFDIVKGDDISYWVQ